MLFFNFEDRAAGVAAMIALFKHMKEKHPDEILFRGETQLGSPAEKDRELRAECEGQWDSMDQIQKEAFVAMWQSCGLAPASYYEAHITIEPHGKVSTWDAQVDAVYAIAEPMMWRFSKIDGDIDLEKGVKWYITRSLKNGEVLFNDMKAICYALDKAGIRYVRRKIEHILFDERNVVPTVRADQIAGTPRAA